MAKKMLIAKAHNTGHTHTEPGGKIKIKFDKSGYLKTDDPEKIAVLQKYNNRYWKIIEEKDLEKEEEERRLREMKETDIREKISHLKKLEFDIKAANTKLKGLNDEIKAAENKLKEINSKRPAAKKK